jgi:hypothetical protein
MLILWGFFAIIAAVLASKKNRSGFGWFLLGVLFGPFAWIVAAFPPLPPKPAGNPPQPNAAESTNPPARGPDAEQPWDDARRVLAASQRIQPGMKKCPQCGAAQPNAQSTCADCGYRFG